uniref:Uncharacterized protein n=1 Tax=Ditylenchus dipsaci TaxID=166011 RepID=A0A915ELK8_9BILA
MELRTVYVHDSLYQTFLSVFEKTAYFSKHLRSNSICNPARKFNKHFYVKLGSGKNVNGPFYGQDIMDAMQTKHPNNPPIEIFREEILKPEDVVGADDAELFIFVLCLKFLFEWAIHYPIKPEL